MERALGQYFAAGWSYLWSKDHDGTVAFQGLHVSESCQCWASLRTVNPTYQHARRTATARQMNPIPYRADYFGHKLHIDQNEKMVVWSDTRGKIVGFITMPVKNNIEIYSHLFR